VFLTAAVGGVVRHEGHFRDVLDEFADRLSRTDGTVVVGAPTDSLDAPALKRCRI
jgi:hypothetical protein